ncbi:Pal1 cell morphology protein [Blumeria hordei DH14]|uniref:Pal1 cell morphology protein n=1 Tax=Blumeria graminis f. sp. hordei (strain DH14) TaxID=546991 RepID=N1JBJ2_BLUG1|nr:Pal1 cell morphology protein [Blumeria hordei DH14]
MPSLPGSSKPLPSLTGEAAAIFQGKKNAVSRESRQKQPPPPQSSRHRLTKSNEEAIRAQKSADNPTIKLPSKGELNVFADPPPVSQKPTEPYARGRKKRMERRRREKKHKERDSKDPRSKKPNHKLDVIDKLDVTSIYGTGLFHHDGPFDACNPHRNRHGSKRAPMQAFPKDSLNNVLGGGGPVNARPDHSTFLGNKDEEAFKDYSKGRSGFNEFEPYNNGVVSFSHTRQESNVVSATTRVEPIHGEETLGLGTSTFLEGAPASRTAMQRRLSETLPTENNLSRSKSLAQKFRGINVPRREYVSRLGSSDGAVSPEARILGPTKPERSPHSQDDSSRKDGYLTTRTESSASNAGVEKLSTRTTASAGNVPRFNGIHDQPSNTENIGEIPGKNSTGFMSRVKSLKGGPRKVKPSLIESSN